MTAFDGFRRYAQSSARNLCVLVVAGSIAAAVPAQSTQAFMERVEMLRAQIKTAVQQQADAAQDRRAVAAAWQPLPGPAGVSRRLRTRLRGRCGLLRSPATQAQYADALDAMGSLDFATGRLNDAGEYLQRSLDIYQGLGDNAAHGRAARDAGADAAEWTPLPRS